MKGSAFDLGGNKGVGLRDGVVIIIHVAVDVGTQRTLPGSSDQLQMMHHMLGTTTAA